MKVLILFLAVLLQGCLMTRSQIQETDDKRRMQTQLQETKAQATVQYQDLEEQLREARGRIEVLENAQRLNRASEGDMKNQAIEERKRFEEKLKVYEETIAKLEKDLQAVQQAMVEQAASRKAEASAPQSQGSSTAGKKKPSLDRANALFADKKWREAIVEFQKYREANPSGKSYPDATYKIGVAFQELGLKDEAKTFYSEVVNKYPKAASADKAKSRLKQLK